jgi:hypothetical protein
MRFIIYTFKKNFVITFIVDNLVEQAFVIVVVFKFEQIFVVVLELVKSRFLIKQINFEHLTRSIKASEKAKYVSINKNVEKYEFNQIHC